jgi:hypothetical protein
MRVPSAASSQSRERQVVMRKDMVIIGANSRPEQREASCQALAPRRLAVSS